VDVTQLESFLKYSLIICGVILVIALFSLRRRGKSALYLCGAVVCFAAVLYFLLIQAPTFLIYLGGFFTALLLVIDALLRNDKKKKQG
jgi:hypothetical protein